MNEELPSVVYNRFIGKQWKTFFPNSDTELVGGKRVSTMCQYNFPHEKTKGRGGECLR